MPSLQTRKVKSLDKSPGSRKSLGSRLRRSVRKSRSSEPYKNITAEKIGEGGFGIVSRPPARCAKFFSSNSKNINQQNINSIVFQKTYYKNPNYISKLSEYDAASRELNIGNIIKDNIKDWKEYYCFTEFICEAPRDKHIQIGADDFQDTYGIAPYCGITLNKILKGQYHITEKEACCLMNALRGLCIGLGNLHYIQVYHKDIHDENILFNPKDGKLRWIDFGLTEDYFKEKKAIGNNWESDPMFVRNKLEDTESLIFNVIQPTLEFIRYKLKKSKNTKLTQRCLDDTLYYLHKIPQHYENHILPNRYRAQAKYFEEIRKIKNKYIDFIEDFIEGYDENQKCGYLGKNKSL